MGAVVVSPTADLHPPTDTSSSVVLEMTQQRKASGDTSTTDGSSTNGDDDSKRGIISTRLKILFSFFVLLIIIGLLLLITNIVIATYCLYDQGYTTAICSVKWKSLRILRKIAETTEPIVSTVIVVLAMALTYQSRKNEKVSCARSLIAEELCPTLKNLFNKYWFITYLIMVVSSFIIHVVTFHCIKTL